MPDKNRPATTKQLEGLERWHAKIPKEGLTVAQASDWMEYLIGKAHRNEKISEQDLSGPPGFTQASRLPAIPPPPPLPASKPELANPPGRFGFSQEEEPTNGTGKTAEPLPCSDAWFTGQINVVRDAKGSIVTVDRMAKIADHAFPGETHAEAMARVMAKAEKAVGL
jgi:hypothetical protein